MGTLSNVGWLSTEQYESFYVEHSEVVRVAATRILLNDDDAQDIVQQVFFKVWTAAGTFHGGNVDAWLTTLAKNCSIDILRRRKVETKYLRARAHGASAESPAPDSALMLDASLALLDRNQRAAVEVCILESLSHSQAAARLGLPLGTLKSRVRAALARLRAVDAM